MFIPASTPPRPSPNSTSAATRNGTFAAHPVSATATQASGWTYRIMKRLPHRAATWPAATLPTPAMTGTTSSRRVSSPSVRPMFVLERRDLGEQSGEGQPLHEEHREGGDPGLPVTRHASPRT